MGQSVKHQTLDFRSGHDFAVHVIEPHVGLCTKNMEPAWNSLTPSLSVPLQLMCTLSLSLSLKNKYINKE